jgi:hypothetical protein
MLERAIKPLSYLIMTSEAEEEKSKCLSNVP